jgi:hypothetical protein
MAALLVLTLVATGPGWGEAIAMTAGDVVLVSRPRRAASLPEDPVDVLLPLVVDVRSP